jgi:hypothetical protein
LSPARPPAGAGLLMMGLASHGVGFNIALGVDILD